MKNPDKEAAMAYLLEKLEEKGVKVIYPKSNAYSALTLKKM